MKATTEALGARDFSEVPKTALTLAQELPLVPLSDLAEVRLGLKTGKDAFFFVRDVPAASIEQNTPPRAVVVRGLNGWQGVLSRADILPAILNPHQLDASGGRSFRIGRRTGTYYLYPNTRTLREQLKDYVRFGERNEVQEGELVRSNATPGRWYAQNRQPIRSRWVLPYNSAYDYGAWENLGGAVLNGRFVGVDVREGVDPDLLGASLNSTICLMTRLLEGVATGVENAYDVGPLRLGGCLCLIQGGSTLTVSKQSDRHSNVSAKQTVCHRHHRELEK